MLCCRNRYDKVQQFGLVLYTCLLFQSIFALIFIFGYFSQLIRNDALLFTTMVMSFVNIVWVIYNTLFLIKDVINKHNTNVYPISNN